jgi:colanic acid/amylovoran biosynthesis glycosyltransferase
MRIAFVVSEFPSVSETFILNQITGLLDLGHQVDVYAWEGRMHAGQDVHPDVELYGLQTRTRYYSTAHRSRTDQFLWAARTAAMMLQVNPVLAVRALGHSTVSRSLHPLRLAQVFHGRLAYDVAHCHFGVNGPVGVAMKRLGVAERLAVTFHGYELSKNFTPQIAAGFRRLSVDADVLLPVCHLWSARLAAIGVPPEKIVVHPMGVDCRRFEYRRRSPGSALRLLTVARLVEKKGVEYGIRAVARLRGQEPDARISLTIIGDGPLRRQLERLVGELGLDDCVQLLGWLNQTDVLERLYGSDVFILPSVTAVDGDQEGIPVSLMEAMATGMPVVSTWHSAIPELIEDGATGFLVPERDEEALAGALRRFLQSPDLGPHMGAAAHKYIVEYHNIARLNDRLVRVYEQLLVSTA